MQRKKFCVLPKPCKRGLGNRGVGAELGIVTLLVIAVMSMVIVAGAMGDVKLQRLQNDYTLKRTALVFLGEAYENKVRNGEIFSEQDFRSRHPFFKEAYSETEAYVRQEVASTGITTTYTLYLMGVSGAQHMKIEIQKNGSTYAVTQWVCNP